MANLKLGPLPDRVPSKLTITLSPDLKKALDDYATLYARSYGSEELVAELVPYMLDAFLKADHSFRQGRKELLEQPMALPLTKRATVRGRKSAATENQGEI